MPSLKRSVSVKTLLELLPERHALFIPDESRNAIDVLLITSGQGYPLLGISSDEYLTLHLAKDTDKIAVRRPLRQCKDATRYWYLFLTVREYAPMLWNVHQAAQALPPGRSPLQMSMINSQLVVDIASGERNSRIIVNKHGEGKLIYNPEESFELANRYGRLYNAFLYILAGAK